MLPMRYPLSLVLVERLVPVAEQPKDWLRRPDVARWARLRLPNRQIARSWWKEQAGLPRTSRNVKVS